MQCQIRRWDPYLNDLYCCAATSLAEKEFVARKAASRGLLAEDLKQLRQEVTVE